MLCKVNFTFKTAEEGTSSEFVYVSADSQIDAAALSQPSIERLYGRPGSTIEIVSVSHLPDGTVITCPVALELIPKDKEAKDPLIFNQPSVLIS